MLPTLFFVMPGFSDGMNRAPVNAFSAGPFSEKEAIGPMIRIRPWRWLNGYPGDYRSRPQGFAFCGDQSVAQTERAQTGRMGGMALRPG